MNGDRTTGDGRQFADYMGLGYSRDHVVVTTNTFAFEDETFRGATVLAFPKARLYDCGRTLTFETFLGDRTRNPDGSAAFTLQPATTVGPGRRLFLLSFRPGRPSFLILWRMRETDAGLRLVRVAIRVNRVGIGPFATQGGGDLDRANTWWDPGDLRLINTFADLDRDRVYAAHVIARDLGPDTRTDGYVEAAIRWYEVRVQAHLASARLTRFGTIGEAETDAGWPTVATDAAGNLFVTYNRASAVTGEFLSAWVAEIVPGARRASAVPLRTGTARLEAVRGPERWGQLQRRVPFPRGRSLHRALQPDRRRRRRQGDGGLATDRASGESPLTRVERGAAPRAAATGPCQTRCVDVQRLVR